MDLKTIVERRLADLNLGPTVAEKRGGLSKMFVSDILKGKKQTITLRMVPRLAKVLEIAETELLGFVDGAAPVSRRSEVGPAFPVDPLDLPRNLPVLGVAAGSAVGAFVIDGAVDHVRRPPSLMHTTNAYALYVTGTSMSPRFEPGDLVFVNPDRPAAPGDTVIIQTRNWDGDDIQAWIKTLVRETADKVLAEQLNPRGTVEYDRRTIVSIHRVLKTVELFGV